MIAKELISKDFPTLLPADNGSKAIEIMENFVVSDLAIVENDIFFGTISMTNIYDFDLFDIKFKENTKILNNSYVFHNQHLFDVVKTLELYNSSLIAVVDQHSKFIGTITQKSILKGISKILSINETGYYIKFNQNFKDYSATEISNIVEKNNAKLLSLYFDNKSAEEITVYVKISTQDIEAILQSFERFNYNITLLNTEPNDYNQLYNERMENFLNFLNV